MTAPNPKTGGRFVHDPATDQLVPRADWLKRQPAQPAPPPEPPSLPASTPKLSVGPGPDPAPGPEAPPPAPDTSKKPRKEQ